MGNISTAKPIPIRLLVRAQALNDDGVITLAYRRVFRQVERRTGLQRYERTQRSTAVMNQSAMQQVIAIANWDGTFTLTPEFGEHVPTRSDTLPM